MEQLYETFQVFAPSLERCQDRVKKVEQCWDYCSRGGMGAFRQDTRTPRGKRRQQKTQNYSERVSDERYDLDTDLKTLMEEVDMRREAGVQYAIQGGVGRVNRGLGRPSLSARHPQHRGKEDHRSCNVSHR